ncbi:MAG: hypothetical protein HKN47_14460 [Pirellulaceae bacterium]|nr:hypothetical protein [Pirellulaceae bacterium]
MFPPRHASRIPLLALGMLVIALVVTIQSGRSERGIDQPAANTTDQELVRQVMLRWKSEILRDGSWLMGERNLRLRYEDVWSTIDLDEAIGLDDFNQYPSILLMEKLAIAGRWDDVQRLSQRYPKGHYHVLRFWSRVAEYGLAQRDQDIISLAGQQVEDHAVEQSNFPGGPPKPTRELVAARFYVAAARLELMRNQSDKIKGHRDLTNAADDLWRVAGAVVPRRGRLIGISPTTSSTLYYAALESWTSINYATFSRSSSESVDSRVSLEPLTDMVKNTKVCWPVRLPTLENPVVTSWVHRQVHQKRYLVALSYLAIAAGDDAHRARLLAYVAAGCHDSLPDQAIACRDLAARLVDSMTHPDQDPWLRIEANAELAMAHQAAGNTDDAKAVTAEALQQYQSIMKAEPDKRSLNYGSIYALICAAATTDYVREQIPAKLIPIIDRIGFHGVPKSATPVSIRGVARFMDLARIAKPASPKDTNSVFAKLVTQKDWPAAVAEVRERAKGNSAWNSSHPDVGAKSVRDMGLPATLTWTANIGDPKTQMMVEMGALLEAVKADRKTLPVNRMWSTADTIAPGVNVLPADC